MTINDVYKKYQHLDGVISDTHIMWCCDFEENFWLCIIYDLWMAVKSAVLTPVPADRLPLAVAEQSEPVPTVAEHHR